MIRKIAFSFLLCWPLVAIVMTNGSDRNDAHADYGDRSPQEIDKINFVADPPFISDTNSRWVDSVFKTLTPEERIGQLFMVAAWSNKDKKHETEISNLIKNEKIGGLIFM